MISYEIAKELLEKNGQSHVLKFWPQLDDAQRSHLLWQIESLDFDSIARMRMILKDESSSSADISIQPAPVVQLSGSARIEAINTGESALRDSHVGVILVAGGQGSRLGYDGPKGCYSIGPVTGASLFEIHSRKILALEQKYDCKIPFYIMTSAANDGSTRDFFKEHKYFGLNPRKVRFFIQGMWPALDQLGRIVLDRPDNIFMSPDGHGGILSALRVGGMIDDMRTQGLHTLFYFQVDNPLVEIADPAFIGLHNIKRADVSVKVCEKRGPEEKLGVVVVRNERCAVVEYSEMNSEQQNARMDDGNLKFRYGSVAIHVFSLDFIAREASADLPLHVARKKVPYCDDNGNTVTAKAPNACKFEKFVFDVLSDADTVVNMVFRREEEFSPVKNAEGEDSPATSRRDMMEKWARWLLKCGVNVPRKANGDLLFKLEIDPCFALNADDLANRLPEQFSVTEDTVLR
ncbi:MAG: UDPGP type 1 family protein [Lentisphaerae bacterium]|nr:UDPGP type 1 family protein [Lentisphaerota bacterium]